jgi:general stress protein 26
MATKKLEQFYKLVDDIEIAMMTTRRANGYLASRPMATQVRAEGADLWFVTEKSSPKVREIRGDDHINLSYYNERTREWISVAGVARIVTDRAKIRELYRPDWRAWFGDDGGKKAGTPDDPRMTLIAVDIHEAQYLELNKPRAVILFEVVKGMLTGSSPKFPDTKTIRGKARAKGARSPSPSRRRAAGKRSGRAAGQRGPARTR